MSGCGSNVTTQQTTPSAPAYNAYNQILSQIQQTAGSPYSPFSGEMTAPVNAQQYAGIGNINQYATSALPAVNAATGLAFANAQPISAADIASYANPYTNQVLSSTEAQMANLNAQQANSTAGSAIASGAFAGNREAVAQAQLAGQQALNEAPTLANIASTGYTTGLSAAEQEQAAAESGATNLGSLGVAGENAALTGANAQVGAGTLEQQTQQARDTAAMNAFYQQEFAPEAMLGWESGLAGGVGSLMGGTSTTTAPPPNPITQALGAGTTLTGLFGSTGAIPYLMAARGGRIPAGGVANRLIEHLAHRIAHHINHHHDRASGGVVPGFDGGGGISPYFMNARFANPYLPSANMPRGPGAPRPPQPPNLQQQAAQVGQLAKGIGQAQNAPGGVAAADARQDAAQDAADASNDADWGMSNFSPGSSAGGIYRRGGVVPHFDDGGDVSVDEQSLDPLYRLGLSDKAPEKSDSPWDWSLPTPRVSRGVAPGEDEPTFANRPPPPPAPAPTDWGNVGNVAPAARMPSIDAPTPDAGFGGPPPEASGVASALPSNGFDDVPVPRPRPSAADEAQRAPAPFDRFVDGIAHNETGGERDPYGSVISTGTGHKVYGKYQIYDDNIPTWTQQALGHSLTPRQFLADPKAQEATARYKLGEYVDKYGYHGAARAWLAGEGGMNNPTAKDKFGSDPYGYATKALAYAGMQPGGGGGGTEGGGTRLAMRGDTMSDAPLPGVAAAADQTPRPGHTATGVAPAGIDLSGSSKLWPALTTAGLGMLASRSPFLGVGVGEGGLAGMTSYNQQKQQEQTTALNKQKMDLEAKRLDQELKRHQDDLSERTQYHTGELGIRRRSEESLEDYRKRENLAPTGMETEDGHPVWGDKTGRGQTVDMVTGQPPVGRLRPQSKVGATESLARSIQAESEKNHAADPSKPVLTLEEATTIAHKAPNASQEELRRRALAQSAWKADASKSLEEWEKFYGVGAPAAAPATPAPGTAPAPGVPTSQATEPARPASVPADAKLQKNKTTGAYRWRAPDGTSYTADGTRI